MMRRNRYRPSAILSSPVTIVLALTVLFFVARAALRIHSRAADSSARLEKARADIAGMEAKQSDLRGKIQDLSTAEGVEASIREKYHAVEPGESVAVIVNTDAAGPAASGGLSATSSSELGWWQSFLRSIGL